MIVTVGDTAGKEDIILLLLKMYLDDPILISRELNSL
jgi:hypothetical protein